MNKRYISNATGVAIFTLVSQILGYVREMLFAYYLGTSNDIEAFQVAETVPLLFTQILISAVPLAVTPLFVREESEEKDALIHAAFVSFGVLVLLLGIVIRSFPELFVNLVAPGFEGDKYYITCRLIIILAPNVIFLPMAAVMNAYTNAKRQFIIPAAAGLLLNISIVVMQLVTDADVYAVAKGSVFGGIAMFFVVYIYCVLKYRFYINLKKISWRDVKVIFWAVLPVCVVSSFSSINLILDKYFASQLGDGMVATLSYSYKIINLPVYLFVTSVTKVLLPDITKLLVDNEYGRLAKLISKILFCCLGGGLLVIGGIQVVGEWIVKILFGRGAFSDTDIIATANILKMYSFGVFGMALSSFFQSVSYAAGKYFEPFKVLAVQILIYIIIVVTTIDSIGVNAIVCGNVVSFSASIVIWLIIMKSNYHISIFGKCK